MAVEYLQTTNNPVEEIKVEGYKPQFSNDYYWNRVRKPKQENTETEPENESVSQEDVQGDEIQQETRQETRQPQQTSQETPVQEQPKEVKQETGTKSKRYTDRSEFVKDLTEAYTNALRARGIDTAYAKMLVAQDALESG